MIKRVIKEEEINNSLEGGRRRDSGSRYLLLKGIPAHFKLLPSFSFSFLSLECFLGEIASLEMRGNRLWDITRNGDWRDVEWPGIITRS